MRGFAAILVLLPLLFVSFLVLSVANTSKGVNAKIIPSPATVSTLIQTPTSTPISVPKPTPTPKESPSPDPVIESKISFQAAPSPSPAPVPTANLTCLLAEIILY